MQKLDDPAALEPILNQDWPWAGFAIGDLELYPFSPDHRSGKNYEEWDVLPFLVKDRGGDGNFFSTVDVEPTAEMRDAARAIVPRPGL